MLYQNTYFMGSYGVKRDQKLYVCLEFCLSHFLSRGQLVPRGLFSMVLNDNIIDIEKLEGICSLTFVADEFSGLFSFPSIFFIKDSRSA